LQQLQSLRSALVNKAAKSAAKKIQPSLKYRLESIEIKDPADWMRWVNGSNVPADIQEIIDLLDAGDAYWTSVVLEIRTDMGL